MFEDDIQILLDDIENYIVDVPSMDLTAYCTKCLCWYDIYSLVQYEKHNHLPRGKSWPVSVVVVAYVMSVLVFLVAALYLLLPL